MNVVNQLLAPQKDAFKCLISSELDVLTVGTNLLLEEEQHKALKENFEEHYELD
jgi:hypothetical protein